VQECCLVNSQTGASGVLVQDAIGTYISTCLLSRCRWKGNECTAGCHWSVDYWSSIILKPEVRMLCLRPISRRLTSLRSRSGNCRQEHHAFFDFIPLVDKTVSADASLQAGLYRRRRCSCSLLVRSCALLLVMDPATDNVLDAQEFHSFPLAEKQVVSHD